MPVVPELFLILSLHDCEEALTGQNVTFQTFLNINDANKPEYFPAAA